MSIRWISVFVGLALVVALAGCSGRKNSNAPATTNHAGRESNALPPNPSGWTAGTDLSKFDLLAIDFVDERNGWTVGDISPEGGPLLHTSDGGNSWQVIARITEVFSSIQFINPTTGWMAGYAGRIERTDDGGRTWKTQRIEREGDVLNALFFIDSEHGWAVGGRGLVLRTTDGGTHWEPSPNPRVEDLWAVRFATPERGWAVGEDGLIVATTDGGATWVQQKSGTNKALFGLALLPSGGLVAVGESGTILRREAGKDWQAVHSGTLEMLNAVAAADDQTLWAVGSGGALVTSTDGGNTWAVVAPVSARHLLAIALLNAKRAIAVGRRGAIQKLQE
ncbi:MAG: hypothetical protein HY231_26190 [Acidobacteria bacterium]|nr:hypothetical protein [Acidobacteriota bacterium]